MEIMPGMKVLVFDWSLYKDDVTTPLSITMKPATVIRRYGMKYPAIPRIDWPEMDYSDLVDVIFDHRPERESKAHFTNGVCINE